VPGIEQIEAMYRGQYRSEQGTAVQPPWVIGRPQPAVVDLVESGRVHGRVLDAGCGTGEHAVYLAEAGHAVVGIDAAPTAVARARDKAAERGVEVDFEVGDATELTGHLDEFDTVIDVGLLHMLDRDRQPRYVAALHRACRRGALVHVLCFTQAVDEERLRELFGDGWEIQSLDATPVLGLVPDQPLYMDWADAEPGDIAELPAHLLTARRR
jgi:SAM-dependent methyltransferase